MNNYRAEIDGLRGIAVLSVVLYHSEIILNGKNLFTGGFLGVDIFFVISGFLITRILLFENNKKGFFSFKNFYERRVRRLLPALIFVIIFSTILAYHILLPSQFLFFIKSAISSIFFFSNFFFHYAGESYGQSILTEIPLLHTWSLSIEEQFYLIYPFFLFIIFKYFKKNINLFLLIILISSLIFSLIINDSHASFNFYMLPSRGWELIIGALLAVNEKKLIKSTSDLTKNILSIIGFVVLILSFFLFENIDNHPGLKTLAPVFGVAFIIYFSNKKNYINRILSIRILKNLGLISYSLYLWHHSIFSFAKILSLNQNSFFIKIILIIISLIFSYLSFIFVEKKFRDKNFSFRVLLKGAFISISTFFILCYYTMEPQKKNFPSITRDLYTKTWFITKQNFKPCFQRKKVFCEFVAHKNNPNIFLIGDSVMASLQEELKINLINSDYNFITMTNAGCDFIRLKNDTYNSTFCNNSFYDLRKRKLLEKKRGLIIVYLNYERKLSLDDKRIFKNEILEFLNLDYKIVFIYPIPYLEESVSDEINKVFRKFGKSFENNFNKQNYVSIKYDKFKTDSDETYRLLNSINHKNLFTVFPEKIFCESILKNHCVGHDRNDIFYIDNSHLSKKGSELINKELLKTINKIYK